MSTPDQQQSRLVDDVRASTRLAAMAGIAFGGTVVIYAVLLLTHEPTLPVPANLTLFATLVVAAGAAAQRMYHLRVRADLAELRAEIRVEIAALAHRVEEETKPIIYHRAATGTVHMSAAGAERVYEQGFYTGLLSQPGGGDATVIPIDRPRST